MPEKNNAKSVALQKKKDKDENDNPQSLIELALSQDVDVDKLEKLIALKERYDANKAKAAFAKAMTLCQQEMPNVLKDSKNDHTKSQYASLEAVNKKCKPVYTKHGFSIQFSEGKALRDGETRILADVMHSDGYEKQYFIDLPRDGIGSQGNASSMNKVQGAGSTFSYGQRYLTKMIFNLTIGGEDTDGNAPTTEPPAAKKKTEPVKPEPISDLVKQTIESFIDEDPLIAYSKSLDHLKNNEEFRKLVIKQREKIRVKKQQSTIIQGEKLP
jgi:hypothetical protein